MALVVITFPAPYEALVVDATTYESHDMQSLVTEHPVETGSTISDNIRPLPRSLTIECLVSPSPISNNYHAKMRPSTGEYEGSSTASIVRNDTTIASRFQIANEITNFLGVNLAIVEPKIWNGTVIWTGEARRWTGNTTWVPNDIPEPYRANYAYVRLYAAWLNGSVLAVTTDLDTYPAMAIRNLSIPRRAGLNSNLFFTATLQEILYAAARTTSVPKSAIKDLRTQRAMILRGHQGNRPLQQATTTYKAG